jgi:hypothetical protein
VSLVLAPGPACGDPIPEPDAIYYGEVLRNDAPQSGVTLLLRLGQTTLDQYTIGSNAAAGTFYVLRARLFDPVAPGDTRPQGAAFIGDMVSLYIQGEATPRQQFQINDRGAITQFDISVDVTPAPTSTFTPTIPPGIVSPSPSPGISATPTITATFTPTTPPTAATVTGTVSPTPTPTPTASPTVTEVASTLTGPIGATDMQILIADVSLFPDSGVIRIDDELIHFSGKTVSGSAGAAAEVTNAVPGSLNNVTRGFGGTIAGTHSAGAQVVLVPVSSCTGDCSDDHHVTVTELVTMTNVALGKALLSSCLAGDVNSDGKIGINEIVAGVSNALGTCP